MWRSNRPPLDQKLNIFCGRFGNENVAPLYGQFYLILPGTTAPVAPPVATPSPAAPLKQAPDQPLANIIRFRIVALCYLLAAQMIVINDNEMTIINFSV